MISAIRLNAQLCCARFDLPMSKLTSKLIEILFGAMYFSSYMHSA